MKTKTIKSMGGSVITEPTDKMLVKHHCEITLPIGSSQIIAQSNAPTEDQAVEWAFYALKLQMEEINEAHARLFEGYQKPNGFMSRLRRLVGVIL